MSTPLPADPYLALGVLKTATTQEIRSAHRKLVLKCHPDKVQDPTQKAAKQDEFQKVQQAYELLTDDAKREAYDDQVRLNKLRSEMGGMRSSGPTSSSAKPEKNVFDYMYDVKEAMPRSSTFRASTKTKESSRVYSQPQPRSYEDEIGSRMAEEPRSRARKTASYEEARRPARDEDRPRRRDEEKTREKSDKDSKKSQQGSAKKSRDKAKRSATEEKYTRTSAIYTTVEDDDSEDAFRPKLDKRAERRMAEEIKAREDDARAQEKARTDEANLTERTRKLNINKTYAAEYLLASRRKAAVEPEEDFRPSPMRRAETFQEPSFSSKYTAPPSPYFDDEDYPRRSAARSSPRRSAEAVPAPRARDIPKSSKSERKNSAPYESKPYIVEAAPPPAARKPAMPTHSSAPSNLDNMIPSRKEPSRSRTMPGSGFSSAPAPPPLARASTFNTGSKPSRERGSTLRQQVAYASDEESDSDDHNDRDHRHQSSYPPRDISPPRRAQPEPIRYFINKEKKSVPISPSASRHRASLRDDDYDVRERSESPRGTPARRGAERVERPALQRSSGSGGRTSSASRAPTGAYYSSSPEQVPIIKEARPKMPAREGTGRSGSNHYFGEVQYAPPYGPVSYSPDGFPRKDSREYDGRGVGGYAQNGYPSPRPRESAYA